MQGFVCLPLQIGTRSLDGTRGLLIPFSFSKSKSTTKLPWYPFSKFTTMVFMLFAVVLITLWLRDIMDWRVSFMLFNLFSKGAILCSVFFWGFPCLQWWIWCYFIIKSSISVFFHMARNLSEDVKIKNFERLEKKTYKDFQCKFMFQIWNSNFINNFKLLCDK